MGILILRSTEKAQTTKGYTYHEFDEIIKMVDNVLAARARVSSGDGVTESDDDEVTLADDDEVALASRAEIDENALPEIPGVNDDGSEYTIICNANGESTADVGDMVKVDEEEVDEMDGDWVLLDGDDEEDEGY